MKKSNKNSNWISPLLSWAVSARAMWRSWSNNNDNNNKNMEDGGRRSWLQHFASLFLTKDRDPDFILWERERETESVNESILAADVCLRQRHSSLLREIARERGEWKRSKFILATSSASRVAGRPDQLSSAQFSSDSSSNLHSQTKQSKTSLDGWLAGSLINESNLNSSVPNSGNVYSISCKNTTKQDFSIIPMSLSPCLPRRSSHPLPPCNLNIYSY